MIKKLILLATLVMAIALPAQINAQRGESAFGVHTGYTSVNESAIAGLFYHYNFSDAIRVSPELGFVFRHQNLDAFTADINVHFPLEIGANDTVELYPLVGLDVSSWTHHLNLFTTNDVSTRKTKVGANVGAGFGFNASPTLLFKIEAKYTIISTYHTFVASLGIGYRF